MVVALISKMVDLGDFDFVGNTLRRSSLSLQHPFFAKFFIFFLLSFLFVVSLLLSSFLPLFISVFRLLISLVFFLFCQFLHFHCVFCKSLLTSFFLPPVFSLSLTVCNCWSSDAQRVCLCFWSMRTVGLVIMHKAAA